LPDNQLTIAKETGRRLGIGTNMYPSSALLGQSKDKSIAALPVHDLIEKADGFAGVFPGMIQFNGEERHVSYSFPIFLDHKYEIIKCLRAHVIYTYASSSAVFRLEQYM
jgi:hypothetical protein